MKALSLTRPWDWTIVHDGKRIENRSRKDGRMPTICHYRGPLLLHAAKSLDKGVQKWCAQRGLRAPPAQGIATGAIVGRCRVIAHIHPDGGVWHDPKMRIAVEGFPKAPIDVGLKPEDMKWWMGGYAIVLTDVEPTKIVECRGALGCWNVPDDVMAALQLKETA